MSVRVRFAPSPTGHLHVGGARTAIFNWLFARHHGGSFIIRSEDTDQARSTHESEAMVLDDLRWLGVPWDEGPDCGGPHVPYRQSERMDLYREVAGALLESRHAYRCFCDEATLEAKRKEAEIAGRPPHYDLTCFRLTESEVAARLTGGAPFVVRFHVPKEEGASFDADVTIHDLIRGEVTWRKESLGDFILLRSDGMPTYNFSVVVDDHGMEITHVIRAEEHLTNTHRQVLLYRALGWSVPEFAHVSLILGPDRSKLSKRHGATSVAAYAADGYLADAMVNYLTLLGWSPPDGNEIFTRERAIEEFSLARVNPAAAVFDQAKLTWMNGQYIHALDSTRLASMLKERFSAEGILRDGSAAAEAWLVEAVDIVKKGLTLLRDFVPALDFAFRWSAEAAVNAEANREALVEPGAREVVVALVEDFGSHGVPQDGDGYHAMADRLKAATGANGKKLFMPVRVAVTGTTHGPELQRVIPLLQKGSALAGIAPIVPPRRRAEELLRLMVAPA